MQNFGGKRNIFKCRV